MVTKENHNLPPVIVAPDFDDRVDVIKLAQKLKIVSHLDLGFKIPSYHSQDQDLLSRLSEDGHFVMLATDINDDLPKMRTAVKSFLGRAILPSAITVNPEHQADKLGFFRDDIVAPAHESGVMVVGYNPRNRFPPSDEFYIEESVDIYGMAAQAGFVAFETHNPIVTSYRLALKLQTIEASEDIQAPLIIVSKFANPEASDSEVAVKASLLLRGVLDHKTYPGQTATKANAVYIGERIMKSDDPIGFVSQIAEGAKN